LGSNPNEPTLVSVVITVRNESQHIDQLLDSLVAQEGPLEVVLVDGESRDGTLELAQAFASRHPGLLHVFERPGSRGSGRNVGVHEARGEWVAFIDGDCFADSQWLAKLRKAFSQASVVAGRTVTVGKRRFGQLERVELLQEGYDVTYPSCNLAYRRELFERIGGFDTRFITAEDIDLNMRAILAGAAISYTPEAVVYHHVRSTFLRFLIQAFWNGYGRKQLTEKHGRLWSRYRVRHLISGQKGPMAWLRLTAALAGYATRVTTGGNRRLTLEANVETPDVHRA
jgi:glycosyltransferase AglI